MWLKNILGLLSSKRQNHSKDTWFLSEIKKEDPHAIYQLAIMYANGQGFRKDLTRAYQLIRQSANKGYAQAQLRLWSDYGFGRGLSKCFVLSYVWAQLAVNNGYHSAAEVAEVAKGKLDDKQLKLAQKLLLGPVESIPDKLLA